jgi:phosphoglycolate phosphatase-like HAD superfamily hydrolase
MRILLLDLDGVLLEPRAYHLALQDTVAMVGRALGYGRVTLREEDIELFEAVGVTSEWDSAAICAALLLRRAWRISPCMALPGEPPLPNPPPHGLPPPDFRTFFRSLAGGGDAEGRALARAEAALFNGQDDYSPAQAGALRALLRGARSVRGSLTHRLFQELVLGSRAFQRTYDLRPYLEVESYLLTRDRATLEPQERARLDAWTAQPGQAAAIFTNRPSQPPPGFLDSPEAEMGAERAGMKAMPIVGRGALAWLSRARRADPDAFLKPHPLHTLAALQRALGLPLEDALRGAAALALDGVLDSRWGVLQGARVCVVEDSSDGLRSARAAREVLLAHGLRLELQLLGVSAGALKGRALARAGARVFPALGPALEQALRP